MMLLTKITQQCTFAKIALCTLVLSQGLITKVQAKPAKDFTCKNLTVNEDASIAGALAVAGNFSINTDRFNVVSGSGDTNVGGTFNTNGNLSVNSDQFTVASVNGNTNVGGWLNVAGGNGWTHQFGSRSGFIFFGTDATQALTVYFTNLQTGTPLAKGAYVKIKAWISGSLSDVNSINFYEADLLIEPGPTVDDPSSMVVISQSTTNMVGTAATVTADIAGFGATGTITLAMGQAFDNDNQSVALFYEVVSDNFTAIS